MSNLHSEIMNLPSCLQHTAGEGFDIGFKMWYKQALHAAELVSAKQGELTAMPLELDDLAQDALQSDLENGVEYLNEEEARRFYAEHPDIAAIVGKISEF